MLQNSETALNNRLLLPRAERNAVQDTQNNLRKTERHIVTITNDTHLIWMGLIIYVLLFNQIAAPQLNRTFLPQHWTFLFLFQ